MVGIPSMGGQQQDEEDVSTLGVGINKEEDEQTTGVKAEDRGEWQGVAKKEEDALTLGVGIKDEGQRR